MFLAILEIEVAINTRLSAKGNVNINACHELNEV